MDTEFNFAQMEYLLNQMDSNELTKGEAFLNLLLEKFTLMEQLLDFFERDFFGEKEITPHLDLFILFTCAEKIFSLKAVVAKENQNLPWLKLEIPLVCRISQLQTFKQLVSREREVIQLTKLGKFWCHEYVVEISKLKKEFMNMYDGVEVRNEILEALRDFSNHVHIVLTKKVNSKFKLPPLQALEQDISSLKKIIHQIDLAVTSPSSNKALEKCVLQRALQVTGEFLKSTDSSAHVSKGTHDTLKNSEIPLTTLSSLRDLLSHSNSLLIRKRRVLEWHDHVLKIVREDLLKIRPIFAAILSDKETVLFRELIDAILSIPDVQSEIPYIAKGLLELKAKTNLNPESDSKEIEQAVESFLNLLNEGQQRKFTDVKSGLRKIILRIKYSNWNNDVEQILKLNVGYVRETFLAEYMKEKKRIALRQTARTRNEMEEVRLQGTLKVSDYPSSKNKSESVRAEIGTRHTASSYVSFLSSNEIQTLKSSIESIVTRDTSEGQGQHPLNLLEVLNLLEGTEKSKEVQKYLHNLNPTTQINSDSARSIIIRVKTETKKIVFTINHTEWKDGIDKTFECIITSKSLFEIMTASPQIQSKCETVELIIEEPDVPIPQKGISDVGNDLKITKDNGRKTKRKKGPIEMSESELRDIFDDIETSLLAKTHLSREEFDALGSELWPDMITKLSNIDSLRVQTVTEDFCRRHKHVSSQDLFPLMMLVKGLEQIRKTNQAKKNLIEWLDLLLHGGRKRTEIQVYLFTPDQANESTEKVQECKGLILGLSCWSDDDLKQLMDLCDAQKWKEILHHLETRPDSYDTFCRSLAEFWFEGTLPTVEELSGILNLESEYAKLIVQDLEETLMEEEVTRIVENKLNELKQKISLSWTKDFKNLCDKIEAMKILYKTNARMESFLTLKAAGLESDLTQEEYHYLIDQLDIHDLGFPEFDSKTPDIFKKFKNAWLRGHGSKQPNPYRDLIKSSASEKGFKIFLDSLKLCANQKTSLEQAFRSIEIEHLKVYFLQRIELMSTMLYRYTPESVHNYSPTDDRQRRLMNRDLLAHLSNSRFLAGLAFILTDLLDLLKNLGKTLNVEFLDSFLARPDRRWTTLWLANTRNIQFSCRNYLAHGDDLLEVLVPELRDKILLLISLKLLKDGKSLLALMKMAADQDMLQYMNRLEEYGNIELSENELPESLKIIHGKDVVDFKKSLNWKQYLTLLHGHEVETQNSEVDTHRIFMIFGDEIFERIQRSVCSSVITILTEMREQNILQNLTDSMLKWTVFEMAAYFADFQLCLKLISNYGFNNENHPSALLNAAASGNEEVVQLLLDHQFPIHVLENTHITNWGVLHIAANINHLASHICEKSVKLVNALISAGGDVNANGVQNLRPVHLAAKHGYDCIVEILAKIGADLDAIETEKGMTPLHFGAQYGHEKVVKNLLVYHANPLALSRSQHTPLDMAAREGHLNVIKCLVNDIRNVYSGENELMKSAISNAASGHHFDISEYLTIMTRTNPGIILLEAVHTDFKRVKKLLESGTNVNYCDSLGNTALHNICGSTREDVSLNHLEVVNYLLRKGADATRINTKGQTPLHIVMTRRSSSNPMTAHCLKIIKLLIEFGADPVGADNDGQTPLHHAAANNCEEVVRYLASIRVADFSSKDFKGRTALHHSCLHADLYSLDGFKAVLAMSSKVINEKDSYGKTPLHSAIFKLQVSIFTTEEVLKLLLDNGADVFAGHESESVLLSALAWSAALSNDGLIRLILNAMEKDSRKSQFLNAKDKEGMTPLMKACRWHSTKVGKLLVQYGADVNLVNGKQNDKTALHYAVQSGEIEMVKFLIEVEGIPIELKADTDSFLHEAAHNPNEEVFNVILNRIKSTNKIPDKRIWMNLSSRNGNTPLMWAAGHGRLKIMKTLLEEGVDVDFRSPKGRTALHWAAEKSKVNSIRFLLEHKADISIRDTSKLPLPVDLWNKYAGRQGIDEAVIREIEALLHTVVDGLTK